MVRPLRVTASELERKHHEPEGLLGGWPGPLSLDDAPLAEAPATERPPADVTAIGAWLRGDGYRGWIPQSEARPTGDHGGARIFLNPTLDASLAAEAARHPIGAAAVREIYEPDLETLKGLALMVKVADDPNDPDDAGDPGDNWLWYETFAVAEDGPPTIAERGAPGCVGCHEAGVDLVMPPDPPSPSEG
ncbi:MAG: hypothetical protein KC486_01045 [Myxococcales bacterium]|nr:hypothetical protein [Myxococcales bacterium]